MSSNHSDEPRGNQTRAAAAQWIGRGQSTPTPTQAVIDRASGCYLWTSDGRKLVDFASGVLVCNLGHRHAGYEKLLRRYTGRVPRNAYNAITEVEVEASARLVDNLGLPGQNKVLWAASGAEGVQKALWAALRWQQPRKIILATRHGFHGKKGLAGDITGFESANPDVRFLSFPMKAPLPAEHYQLELDALAREHAGDIAVLITEPYLGAAGSYHPPQWYLQLLEAWCRKNVVLLILDEVQSCFGRTGTMYAFQRHQLTPDLVVLGKGMGNGVPVSAVVGRAPIVDSLLPGEGSDTFSAHPEACAAVCAALDVFEQEDILGHVREVAPVLNAVLTDLQDRFPFIAVVRGEGMVYGVEMETAEIANRCVLQAYRGDGKHGVHFLGPLAGNVLRVSPPLIITAAQIEKAARILRTAWRRI